MRPGSGAKIGQDNRLTLTVANLARQPQRAGIRVIRVVPCPDLLGGVSDIVQDRTLRRAPDGVMVRFGSDTLKGSDCLAIIVERLLPLLVFSSHQAERIENFAFFGKVLFFTGDAQLLFVLGLSSLPRTAAGTFKTCTDFFTCLVEARGRVQLERFFVVFARAFPVGLRLADLPERIIKFRRSGHIAHLLIQCKSLTICRFRLVPKFAFALCISYVCKDCDLTLGKP